MVHDVTNEDLQDFMQENQIVLGPLEHSCRNYRCSPPGWYPFDQPCSKIHDSRVDVVRMDDEHNSPIGRGTHDIKLGQQAFG